jgi:hypothetical protein
MRAIWDLEPQLPYKAVAPWPRVEHRGYQDWVQSVDIIELWLEKNVGHHWVHWSWSMWSLHNPQLCGVSFLLEKHSTLFLLRWG